MLPHSLPSLHFFSQRVQNPCGYPPTLAHQVPAGLGSSSLTESREGSPKRGNSLWDSPCSRCSGPTWKLSCKCAEVGVGMGDRLTCVCSLIGTSVSESPQGSRLVVSVVLLVEFLSLQGTQLLLSSLPLSASYDYLFPLLCEIQTSFLRPSFSFSFFGYLGCIFGILQYFLINQWVYTVHALLSLVTSLRWHFLVPFACKILLTFLLEL